MCFHWFYTILVSLFGAKKFTDSEVASWWPCDETGTPRSHAVRSEKKGQTLKEFRSSVFRTFSRAKVEWFGEMEWVDCCWRSTFPFRDRWKNLPVERRPSEDPCEPKISHSAGGRDPAVDLAKTTTFFTFSVRKRGVWETVARFFSVKEKMSKKHRHNWPTGRLTWKDLNLVHPQRIPKWVVFWPTRACWSAQWRRWALVCGSLLQCQLNSV